MALRTRGARISQANCPRKRVVLPAEVRVDDLMSAAADLFITRGIDATTVSHIVEQANVGKGTFYHYFATKEDVILALQNRFMQRFMTAVAKAMAECAPDDHPARFAAWLRSVVEAYLADYRLHDVVFHEFRPRKRNVKDKDIVITQLSELLTDGRRSGAWSIPDVRIAALVIFDGMHGVVDDAIAADRRDAGAICEKL
ncbi:MAG: TetR/AcrR family transcriptional regulator, partial [Rhodospirillaceae bacterium]|nr:TetR/AcrR family transcriptional regulator [Rhodospirillaceae bacterium]